MLEEWKQHREGGRNGGMCVGRRNGQSTETTEECWWRGWNDADWDDYDVGAKWAEEGRIARMPRWILYCKEVW